MIRLHELMASTSCQTTPSSALNSTPSRWDVFLSFRGTDTRYKFTSHLYDALDRHGVRTFKDDPELRSGEVISEALLEAIRESRSYIVVFSENYASSPWCLDELVEIYNCHTTFSRLVIPVFYNIDPSAVRHQIGSFKEAFEKYENRFSGEMEKLNKWRLTLTEVAKFSGKHASENRSEAIIINEIVDEILLEIDPKTLYVAKYPVGLDSRVKDITTMLSRGAEGVIRFGMYGMGGVGKTTLAKALYNQLLLGGSFKDSCFLANCREVSGTAEGLVSLQQTLLNDILRSKKCKVNNVDHGIKLIRERICSTKVLVVIDDLDHHKQFEYLVGPFSSGSLVIVTTRDEELLEKIDVEPIYRYRVNELDVHKSLKLLTRHAFGIAQPSSTLMVLTKEILRYAGGLPLALEVFGSNLYKRPEAGWKSFIKKLQRIPDSTIQQRLIISLHALESDDPILKKMFLDIACFLIGSEKNEAVKILETYYCDADYNINILKQRCLLTINNRNKLGMHDLLRDMGREISRNNYPNEPGKHSRLWAVEDICNVLKKHKGTEVIECIMPCNTKCGYSLEGMSVNIGTFKRMGNLRFLDLTGLDIIGSFEEIFEDLRWLRWGNCPLTSFPSGFCLQKLVYLVLRDSNMRTWELNNVLQSLKTLDMSFSKDLTTTPDFTKLPCLEALTLRGCKSLEEVHISFGNLKKLVSLDLSRCVKLRSLPDTICNLRALKVLCIHDCCSLKALPVELGKIESLKELYMNELNVSELPNSIGHLIELVELRLSNNRNLRTLPDTICSLRSLEILDISRCEKLKILPDKFWNLTRLRELDACATPLKKVPDIESSQSALSNLEELNLTGNALTTLPRGIGQLLNLRALKISCSFNLLFIAELPPNLTWIDAYGCSSLKRLPNLSNLKQLEVLELTGCSRLREIQGLMGFTQDRF